MQFARKLFLSLAVATSALIVAGCGGGDEGVTLSPQALSAAKAGQTPLATLSPNDAAEALLNAAEQAYPTLFTPHATTQSYGPFRFRQYGSNLLGVVVTADAAYQLYGVYSVGPAFPGSTLANPAFHGSVQNLIGITIDVGGGTTTGHKLIISGTVAGYAIPPTEILNVPAPNTEQNFCTGLSSDTTFTQLVAGGGGVVHITGCSYSGTSGTVSGTVSITYGPQTINTDFSLTFTYQ